MYRPLNHDNLSYLPPVIHEVVPRPLSLLLEGMATPVLPQKGKRHRPPFDTSEDDMKQPKTMMERARGSWESESESDEDMEYMEYMHYLEYLECMEDKMDIDKDVEDRAEMNKDVEDRMDIDVDVEERMDIVQGMEDRMDIDMSW